MLFRSLVEHEDTEDGGDEADDDALRRGHAVPLALLRQHDAECSAALARNGMGSKGPRPVTRTRAAHDAGGALIAFLSLHPIALLVAAPQPLGFGLCGSRGGHGGRRGGTP